MSEPNKECPNRLTRIRRKGQRKKNIDKATPYIPKEFDQWYLKKYWKGGIKKEELESKE